MAGSEWMTAPMPLAGSPHRAKGVERHAAFLAGTPLFKGVEPDQVSAMLGCLDAQERRYAEGEYIYRMGDKVSSLGVVVEGAVRVETVDAWGSTSIIAYKDAGNVFAESYAAVPSSPMMMSVVAARDCDIVFLNVMKLHTSCSHACLFHALAAGNLLEILARNNQALSRHIQHVMPKNLRGKVLAYLSSQANAAGTNEFDIPFNRQQLADYLGVDRSALSAELSKMQKEGILTTRRSHFVLNDTLL
ncbi:MAG: Crp/Fnr family transcriptional regulator [Eggerthellaceae bacterium]